MGEYLVKRLAQVVPTLIFVSMLIFSLQQLLPGDPAKILAGEEQDPSVIAHLREKMHLDEALPVRYAYWVGGVLQGDLGESVRTQQPVLELVKQKLPVTIQLALMAFVIALVIGIPTGIVAAVGRGTWWDSLANAVALWGISTPNFWLGILMILLFSVQLGWLPASGYVSPFEDLKANLASMIMPAFVLGNAIAAVLMRHTRSAMLQVLSSDYVRTARAKGLQRAQRGAQARAAQRAHAGDHARCAGVGHAAVGRGAHRTGVHHPRLRQADRRLGVQPRLRGGAGRGAGDGDGVRDAELAGGPGLLRGESAVAGLM